MDALGECHSRLARLLGARIEPIEVWRCAEEHRAYWRPELVRVILLAESHVYTTTAELSRRLVSPTLMGSDVPRGFVRLVYCLGYGEEDLLDQPLVDPRNSGTPQFWKIFYSCVNRVYTNEDFKPILKRAPFPERIRNKLALLRRLKEAGVWLVDTSLAALYPKPAPPLVDACLRTSWDAYVSQIVKTARPSLIVCVGRGVKKSLGDRLNDFQVETVPQPNAHLTSAEQLKGFQQYYDVVRQGLQKKKLG